MTFKNQDPLKLLSRANERSHKVTPKNHEKIRHHQSELHLRGYSVAFAV